MTKELMKECVNAHDRCYEGGSCPYCEPVHPLRYEDGKFARVYGLSVEFDVGASNEQEK